MKQKKLKKIYINWRGPIENETIDELEQLDGQSMNDFMKEVVRLKNEYLMAGMAAYISQRSIGDWINE